MIDKVITRPLLVVTTFIKRRWVLVILVLLLLYLVPRFFDATTRLISQLKDWWDKLNNSLFTPWGWGKQAANAAGVVMRNYIKVTNWLESSAHRWVLPLVILPFFPLAGATIAVWLLIDRFKKGGQLDSSLNSEGSK